MALTQSEGYRAITKLTARTRFKKWFLAHSPLPGFALASGVVLFGLTLVVLIPLMALFLRASGAGWSGLVRLATDDRVVHALLLSFGTSFGAALFNAPLGVLLAWVLVRYEFPGRKLMDAAIDLPFALPTAVAGIALTAIYAQNGVLGAWLGTFGIKVAYTPLGIVIALVFIGLPFVVRTVQPVLSELTSDIEEAAALLEANRFQTVFRVVLPHVVPATLTGFTLSFARGLGEYGSVIFIAGNIQRYTEIAPLLIVIRLEEYDYAGAALIAAVMLSVAFLAILIINLIQAWSRRKFGHV